VSGRTEREPSAGANETDGGAGDGLAADVAATEVLPPERSRPADAVQPAAATGYVAELRYPGIYKLDGNSGGYCGRAQRYTYLR